MAAATASTNGASKTGQIFLYFAPLTLLVYLATPQGYLLDIATSYMLKNQLHATATQVSVFRLLTGIPVYFSVMFGLLRDQWSPFGLRDRGYFLIFGSSTAMVFVWLSFAHLSYQGLFAGMLLVMLSFRLVSAAYQGLIALVAQEQLMSGRLSALWQIFASLPTIAGAFASGWVAEHLTPSKTFMVVAALAVLLALLGLWKPSAVFGHAYDRPKAKAGDLVANVKRLVGHRAIYPAVLILFMFQFSPGANTPLQFYLANTLHASDAIYGDYNAIFAAAFIPMFFLYAWLCRKFSLKALLWWGTIITVPQMIPLAMIHTGQEAVILAAPIGMLGGIATGAYYDLAMRSCPPGLQGTLMMLVDGGLQLSYRGGDLLGSRIYASSPEHGFLYCVIATTVVYALILPVLLLIPKDLIATTDGQKNPAVDAAVIAEVGEARPVVTS